LKTPFAVRADVSADPENNAATAAAVTGLKLSCSMVRLYPHRALGGDPVGEIIVAEIIDTLESRVTMTGVSRQTGYFSLIARAAWVRPAATRVRRW
jgi:hypothetical protein